MGIDLQRIFLLAAAVAVAAFLALWWLKGRLGKAFAVIGDGLRYMVLNLIISLLFLFCYVLAVKNGYTPSAADMGVAFIPLAVLVYRSVWRLGALSAHWYTLVFPALYSLFLLYRYFTTGGLGYLLFNPSFGFIGITLADTPLMPLGALGAVLPFACAALGKGLGAKHRL